MVSLFSSGSMNFGGPLSMLTVQLNSSSLSGQDCDSNITPQIVDAVRFGFESMIYRIIGCK